MKRTDAAKLLRGAVQAAEAVLTSVATATGQSLDAMKAQAELEQALKGFNPDQPRGADGKFGEGGSVGSYPHNPAKLSTPAARDEHANATSEEAWQDASESVRTAAMEYKSETYQEINAGLREGDLSPDLVADVRAMDQLCKSSSLPSDTNLYRGVDADVLPQQNMTGGTLTDPAFQSTSSDRNFAAGWAAEMGAENTALITIRAPMHANAFAYGPAMALGVGGDGGDAPQPGDTDYGEGNDPQSEYVLPRGSALRIVSDSYGSGSGQRVIIAELLTP